MLNSFLIGIIIRRRTTYELKNTRTAYFVRVCKNLIRVFFTNMVVLLLLANYIEYYVTKNLISSELSLIQIDLENLLREIFLLFITSSLISSLFSIFDVVWLVRLLKRKKLLKDVKKNKCNLTQEDANEIMSGHPVDMVNGISYQALRYANVQKIMQFTMAFSSFQPMGSWFCLLGLFIIYWCDKYLILRRMTCEHSISYQLNKHMIFLLRINVFFFAIGKYNKLLFINFLSINFSQYFKGNICTGYLPELK